MSGVPDWRVYRHNMPRRWWRDELEGAWVNRADLERVADATGEAVATPTNEIVTRDDGAVGEVWEIRLTPAGEARLRAEESWDA